MPVTRVTIDRYRMMVVLLIGAALMSRASASDAPAITIAQGDGKLEVTIGGAPFTTYRFAQAADAPEWRCPYFFPVLSSEGVELTADRCRETAGQAKREHPWHRSLWVGHGDINGLDHWSHRKDGKLQRHTGFTSVGSDNFVEILTWDGDAAAKSVLNEVRTVKFIAYADGARAIDVTSTLPAASGDTGF